MQYDAHKCLLQLLTKISVNIKDDCKFKVDKTESSLRSDFGHISNNDDVCIEWPLHSEDSCNVQIITWMLHQLMNSKEEYLENYKYVDLCQKLKCHPFIWCTITQLNISRYIDSVNKKFVPNLSRDEEIWY